LRYGNFEGIRPFASIRYFHNAWPSYTEICEEFCHFHNLAHDTKNHLLLDFDSSGYKIEVGRLKDQQVTVHLQYLKKFLAASHLSLEIHFRSFRYSSLPLAEVPMDCRELKYQDDSSIYHLSIDKCDFQKGFTSFSKLRGKVIIFPTSMEEAGVGLFHEDNPEDEDEFIIDIDDNGKHITFTSNPDKLSNSFGTNSEAPHYLTPVFFRKEVLSKYYTDSDRYSVSDGYLRCLGFWGVQIDNNHPTHVIVFLGDLGRDLPHAERLHWKQFNVLPAENISEVHYRRSFLAQWAAPTAPDLLFRREYSRFNTRWIIFKTWPLFQPLGKGDEHLIQTVRIPVTNSQSELDEQILTLAKLLVDYLNEKAIIQEVGPGPEGEKGLSKFERFLTAKGFSETERFIHFLRDLQALRSSGSAHRKASTYQKLLERFSIDQAQKPEVMSRILQEVTFMLQTLRDHFLMRG
jgi:hypothetical protein